MKTSTMLLLGGAAVGAYYLYKKNQTTTAVAPYIAPIVVPVPDASSATTASGTATSSSTLGTPLATPCVPLTTGAPGTSDGCGGLIPQPAATGVSAGGTPIATLQALPAPAAPAGNPNAISGFYGGNYIRGG